MSVQKRLAPFHEVFGGFLKGPVAFCAIKLISKDSHSARVIDIDFIAQKAKGVSIKHEKLHENLRIFFEQAS